MTMKKKTVKRIKLGVNVTVSPQAHKKMRDDGLKSKPIQNLRQRVNIINNLDKDL